MTRFNCTRWIPVLGLVAVFAVLAARGSAADAGKAKPGRVTTGDLGGAERYTTHVSTDKPIYRTGEPLYVRGVVVRADTRAPLPSNQNAPAFIEITGPKGDIVASGNAAMQESVAGFKWQIPDSTAGGEYKVKVSFPYTGFTPGERKFDIRAYRAPRLKSQIEFIRDGYGPGDAVTASIVIKRAEGGIPAGAKVTVLARVDGIEAHRSTAKVDASGRCTAQFALPKQIERGEGTLAFVIEDGGVVETASKTIPILLQTVDLNIYPEGGDLVAGLVGRVYIEARTPSQKPADIAGFVEDVAHPGSAVAEFRTEHEGRGRFDFSPAKGGKYQLRITQPAGISKAFAMPAVKENGAVIRAAAERFGKGQPIVLEVATTGDKPFAVTLSKREAEVAKAAIDKPAGTAKVTLTPPDSADGVLIATVWDADGVPLAERLVYREPARSVHVQITADRPRYVPGAKASVTVKTTDDSGKAIGALVGVTVSDDSIREMIEKREQAPRLPVMVLLEGEVRELADAHVYLDAANPKAPVALDLLLGTQGWRRMALVRSAEFMAEHGDAARRVMAFRVVTQVEKRMLFNQAGGRGGFPVPMAAMAGAPRAPAAPVAAAPEVAAAEPLKDAKPDEKPGNDAAQPEVALRPAVKQEVAEAAPIAPPPPAEGKLEQALGRAQAKRQAQGIAAGDIAATPARNDFIVIREYAHPFRPDRVTGQRSDFTETLYWHAGLRTDAKTGEATAQFSLSDSVTSFRVTADALSDGGGLGAADKPIESVEPFYVEPKLPLEVTVGDRIMLPLGVVNATDLDLPQVRLYGQVAGMDIADLEPFKVGPDSRVRRIMAMTVKQPLGVVDFVINAEGGALADKVTRKIRAVPQGFPITAATGGMLDSKAGVTHTFTIPATVVAGSLRTSSTVYPTPLANMTGAMERLIQEPNGCFEQSSSTVYPLVMAQRYFTTHTGVDPKLVERSRTTLDTGYQKLIGFECKQRGYEWFGGDPGHEALTAYGLMEFTDMAGVRQVDPQMLRRTSKWLMDRREADGTYKRNSRALDSFGGAPQEHTDAYVTWALLEAGEKGLEPQVQRVRKLGQSHADSYIVALAANVDSLAGDKEAAHGAMDRLAAKQNAQGMVDGGVTSITRSGGESLQIETTSLAVLAWLRDPAYAANVEKAMKYLASSCEGGRFGTTQSTILALRSIVAYDQSRATPKKPGTVQLYLDGQPAGDPVAFGIDTKGSIQLPDVASKIAPGKHTIELRMSDGSAMPCSLSVNYNSITPATSEQCKVDLSVKLRDASLAEGAVTEAAVTVVNNSGGGLPTPVAIIGIPGGLEVRHDQLKELVKAGKIDAYEVIGREVILYWREMKPKQKVELPISLVAAIPGTYTGPASRAYLYYTDEHKRWVDGLNVTIAPAGK